MTGLYWGASEAARSERLAAYIRGTYPIRKNGQKGEPYGVVQHQNQRGEMHPVKSWRAHATGDQLD
jgi:hypothetical protein